MSSKELSLPHNAGDEVKELVTLNNNDAAISVEGLSKCFHVYEQPRHRLFQLISSSVGRVFNSKPSKYYREYWALKDISFSMPRGQTVGIIGRNGSGKSTLLQLICGTLVPTDGAVEVSGRVAALLELGAGFNPEFSGRENVYLNGAILGLSREEIDRRFEAIVGFADIGEYINQPVKTYSSGMSVRLAFAVAINVDPEILIVDEALSVGDELFQRKCFSRIEEIRNKGATILFVSHSGSTIIELCDRAILIDSGEMLADGHPKEVVGKYQKLLYAAEERKGEVRELIKRGDDEQQLIALDGSAADTVTSLDSFDPGLVPASTISYECRGAEIGGASIFNSRGVKVNNISRGETYFYRYSVNFTASAELVRFGMLIKTVSGSEIGGAVSAANTADGIACVFPGQHIDVEFSFRCMLNPGVYFMNAGVTGVIDGVDTYLHRLLDAASFRVIHDDECLSTSVVDFGCVPKVEFSEKQIQ